jgi:Zn finger protein HypA/HybF involved in hydrogenase expression
MQINIEKNLVEFTPENADETKKIEALWKIMIDCVRFSKKLVPVGEFIPQKNTFARFAIEGLEVKGAGEYAEVYMDKEGRCYCQTCNKYVELKKGDRIPPCCGKLMEVLD